MRACAPLCQCHLDTLAPEDTTFTKLALSTECCQWNASDAPKLSTAGLCNISLEFYHSRHFNTAICWPATKLVIFKWRLQMDCWSYHPNGTSIDSPGAIWAKQQDAVLTKYRSQIDDLSGVHWCKFGYLPTPHCNPNHSNGNRLVE